MADYEAALDAFLRGDWSIAYERLHLVPPQDLGKDFILGYIIQHNHKPPTGWDGVIASTRARADVQAVGRDWRGGCFVRRFRDLSKCAFQPGTMLVGSGRVAVGRPGNSA